MNTARQSNPPNFRGILGLQAHEKERRTGQEGSKRNDGIESKQRRRYSIPLFPAKPYMRSSSFGLLVIRVILGPDAHHAVKHLAERVFAGIAAKL